MQSGGAQCPVTELIETLDDSKDPVQVVAIVWTWLEDRMLSLGSLRKKPYAIKADARRADPYEGWNEREQARLEEAPLAAAAELLVRVHYELEQGSTSFARRTSGMGGKEVWVMWKEPALAILAGGGPLEPPAAVEHPSLATLAPRLAVCPVMHEEIELDVVPNLQTPGWRIARGKLDNSVLEPAPTLSVHLNTLGDAGLSGWKDDEQLDVGWFDEQVIEAPDERACAEAVYDALQATGGSPSILLLPELVATSNIERVIVETIPELGSNAPALTIVGRYHRPHEGSSGIDPRLIGNAELATRVNEAIVLGPDGEELWRHRKLSCAQLHEDAHDSQDLEEIGDAEVVEAGIEAPATQPGEDTVLGRTLQVVGSPLGTLAVVICLDSFSEKVRNRLARSGAEVIFVPSLSPKVHRHRDSLQQLVQTLWGIAFVCNRAFKPPRNGNSTWQDPENSSFWAVQRRKLEQPQPCAETTAFVFRLADAVRSRRPEIQA